MKKCEEVNTYLLFPLATILCSIAVVRSLGRGTLSSSFLRTVQALELAGSEESSDLFIPLTPGEDLDL